jgi:hypothetical protein
VTLWTKTFKSGFAPARRPRFGWGRVYKEESPFGDWIADCEKCPERSICGSWRDAMEAAWGHYAMGCRP